MKDRRWPEKGGEAEQYLPNVTQITYRIPRSSQKSEVNDARGRELAKSRTRPALLGAVTGTMIPRDELPSTNSVGVGAVKVGHPSWLGYACIRCREQGMCFLGLDSRGTIASYLLWLARSSIDAQDERSKGWVQDGWVRAPWVDPALYSRIWDRRCSLLTAVFGSGSSGCQTEEVSDKAIPYLYLTSRDSLYFLRQT